MGTAGFGKAELWPNGAPDGAGWRETLNPGRRAGGA